MPLRVVALVLAAGSSRRMGRSKQLLPLGNKPVIRHCVDTIAAADIQDIVVVVHAKGDDINAVLHDAGARIVKNDEPDSQMADSVKVGLRALDRGRSGVLLCLSDHPLVSVETVKAMLGLHEESPEKIIIPVYQGKRGHPALFPRAVLEEIFSGGTLRDIIRHDEGRVLPLDVPDEGVVLDMDTEDEYQRVRDVFDKQAGHRLSERT